MMLRINECRTEVWFLRRGELLWNEEDSFPEEAQEITVSGNDSARVEGIEPGSYTVLVTALDDLNGTAVIR